MRALNWFREPVRIIAVHAQSAPISHPEIKISHVNSSVNKRLITQETFEHKGVSFMTGSKSMPRYQNWKLNTAQPCVYLAQSVDVYFVLDQDTNK